MDEGLLATEFQADIDAIRRVAIVPTILDVLCRTTGMGFAAVARVTPERWIACSVRDMIAFGLEPGGELQVETTICHEIRQSGEAVVIDNVAEDRRFCDHRTPALYGFQSYISMPIILPDGQFFGTLCAIDLQPRRLSTPEIVNSFKLFAELIAFHLDAARRVAESEARLARAQELSELREQFIAVLGHDLRNPLAAVSAGMRLLTRRPERAAEIAGHMEESILRMSGLIDDVMDFARGRLGDGLTIRQDVVTPLEPVLAQIVQELRSAHPERQIDLDISLEQPIRCDPSRIGQLLSNLLANAVAYGDPVQPVRVTAAAAGGAFDLSVANAGEPIPPVAMERLFQPFFRGAVRSSREGLGLGLYIAAEIARAHGGQLSVTSTSAETRFTLRMPSGG